MANLELTEIETAEFTEVVEDKNPLEDLQFNRQCDGCTACCEGWLTADIYGFKMYPGRKCHFVKTGGCSIYERRPKEICVTYLCAWRTDSRIPEWMKPSEAKTISTWRYVEEIEEHYLHVIEAGEKLRVEVLSWLMAFHRDTKFNIAFQINGITHYYGTDKFLQWMSTGTLQKTSDDQVEQSIQFSSEIQP